MSESEQLYRQCSNCMNWIHADARVCPICQHQLSQLRDLKKERPSRLKQIGLGMIGFFFLCIVVSAIGSQLGGDKSKTEQLVVEATPTFTPTEQDVAVDSVQEALEDTLPTETAAQIAAPTNAPAPPAATSTPMPTPIPTALPTALPIPTPTVGPSLDVVLYVSKVLGPSDDISQSLIGLGETLPLLRLNDTNWMIDVAAHLVTIQHAHKKLTEVVPPSEMAGIHGRLVTGTSKCDQATRLIASGIDHLDVRDLERAAILIDECGDGFTGAAKELDRYLSGVSTPHAVRANGAANLREGPGTEFAVVGSANAGQALDVTGRNETGDWLKLKGGEWIATFLVDNAPGELPVVGR